MSERDSQQSIETVKRQDGVDLIKAIVKNYSDEVIAEGYVWTSSEYIIEVRMPDEYLLTKKLPLESKAKLYVRSPFSKEVCYYVLVAEVANQAVRFKIRHKEYPFNNRDYYRVATNINAVVEYQLIGDEKMRLPQPIRIAVKNLSCGGMMFTSSHDLEEGNQYQTLLRLDNTPLTVKFKILRKAASNDQIYFFGAFFLANTPQKQDTICSYVNRMQVEELMKLDKI